MDEIKESRHDLIMKMSETSEQIQYRKNNIQTWLEGIAEREAWIDRYTKEIMEYEKQLVDISYLLLLDFRNKKA